MVSEIRVLWGYKDKGSLWLQGSGLCTVTGNRPLYGYKDQDTV